MQKSYLYIICVLSVVLCISCNRPSIMTSPSSGRPYEVLVVAEKAYWDSIAGHSLARILNSDISYLPLHESSFRFMYVDPQHFDGSIKLVRSIIMVKIGNKYPKPQMTLQNNAFAAPQCVLTIEAPDEGTFATYVKGKSRQIIAVLTRFEIDSKIASLRKEHSGIVDQAVDSIFKGCRVYVPQELHFVKTGSDFLWASTGTPSVSQNFVMYSYPIDTDSITASYFIAKRDSVMQRNIPGHARGAYVSTERSDLQLLPGKDRVEVRGLWRMKGDFMGGPFISQSYINRDRRKVYVVEVFVYAPDRPKGNLIRGLEASLFTLKMPSVQ